MPPSLLACWQCDAENGDSPSSNQPNSRVAKVSLAFAVQTLTRSPPVRGRAHSSTSATLLLRPRWPKPRGVSLERAVMGRVGAPHQPAIVLGVAGLKAKQAAIVCGNVDSAFGHGRLEQDGRPDVDAPKHLARVGGHAKDLAGGRANEGLAVDQRGRRGQAIGLLVLLLLVQVLFPDYLFARGINALQSVAHRAVQLAVVNEWLGTLIRPDAANRAFAKVAHRLA